MFSNIKSEKNKKKKEIIGLSKEEGNNTCFECGNIKNKKIQILIKLNGLLLIMEFFYV